MSKNSRSSRNRLRYVIGISLSAQALFLVMGYYLKETLPKRRIENHYSLEDISVERGEARTARRELFRRARARLEESSASKDFSHSTSPVSVLEANESPQSSSGPRVIEHVVELGDTLSSIWSAYDGETRGALLAAKAFYSAHIPLSSIVVGEVLELELDSDGKISGLKKSLSDGRTLVLSGDSSDGFEAEVIKPEIVEKRRIASGVIHHSFSASLQEAGVPYEVVDELVDLFGNSIEFRRDIQPGDSFTVVYKERFTKEGLSLGAGTVQLASIDNAGEFFAAVRHLAGDGKAYYYNSEGEVIGNFFLRYPVKFSRISSQFSTSRFHPVLKRHRAHNGVDFAAPIGTPVRSVATGRVRFAAYNGGSGRMVKIQHDSRYQTAYLHLNSIAKGIRPGTVVERGQVIGTVGKTGLATGPHLHYSFYDKGRYVDPLKIDLPTLQLGKDAIPQKVLAKKLETLRRSHEKIQLANLTTESRALG